MWVGGSKKKIPIGWSKLTLFFIFIGCSTLIMKQSLLAGETRATVRKSFFILNASKELISKTRINKVYAAFSGCKKKKKKKITLVCVSNLTDLPFFFFSFFFLINLNDWL
jgi:hypothetical protein